MELYEGTDRVRQVNWLRQAADGISYYDMDGSATPDDAADLVNFWLSHPDAEVPQWFDDADKELLVSMVAELLA